MIYAGHQISFIPWIGYWKKISDSDFFDLSIYEQFTKSTWIHYTYIGNNGKLVKWKLPVEKLWLINLILTEKIYNLIQLNTKLAILPNFDDKDDATTKIIKQAHALKCDQYLSGPHGINYLNLDKFKETNIEVKFQDTTYLYENYRQSIVSLISIYGLDYVLRLLKG